MYKFIIVILSLISISSAYSQINTDYMDPSIRPQDDLYQYVNGNWMKKTEIPADRGRWGSFDQLRENTDSNTLNLLNQILSLDYSKGSEEQKIKDLYQCFLDFEFRNKQGLNPLKPYYQGIDKISNLTQFYDYLIELSQIGLDPFAGVWVGNHMKRSNENAVYLGDIRLGLGRDYFQKNDAKSTEVLKYYEEYLDRLYRIIYPNTAEKIGVKIVAYEKEVANSLLTVEEIRDSEKQYNPIAVRDFNQSISKFPLQKYLSNQRYTVDTVIIGEINYYKSLDKFIHSENISFLKDYLKIQLLNHSMRLLSKELDSIHFDFYGKVVSGQTEQRKIEKRALETINNSLGEVMGKVYVKHYFSPAHKSKAEEMVAYLKKSFDLHIRNLKWMSNDTKAKALDKLNKITVKIGYPNQWKDYSAYEVKSKQDSGSYFINMIALGKWHQDQMRAKIGKPVDRSEWGMNPQTVNAYYNPSNNEIVFPAAILQPPFFSFDAHPAINFGGIGAVIGHEISHGFDDGGSQYDGDGNLRNWWSDEDKAKFKKATSSLEAQYNQYEPLPKMFVNGKFTLGENIADLAGISVAYDAFKLYLKDHPELNTKRDYPIERDFFMSWATIWRTKMREKAMVNMIKTDPHSPGYFRAIGPIVNIDAFYDVFEVTPGDKLYKEPQERIVIW